ncbi:MAG: NUDIX domain-containing protein [Reyranellaceae bacterium]
MPQTSAGILLYRRHGAAREIFLVHPGGPFWARKDEAAWSIPKGLIDPDEEPLAAARREFREETGFDVDGDFADLGMFTLTGGKKLHVFALESDCDPAKLKSNDFELEWPPRSGRRQSFPEIDRGAWFDPETALRKITKGQRPLLQAFFARQWR